MTPELQTTLDNLPDRPGVYLMKDARGEVIYVGKAQSLRNRVRSYWQKGTTAGAIHLIREVIDKVAELDYTLTDSDSEAFLLEVNLIKRHRPRFNIRLKDDKSYPYIKITLGDDFPRVERTRRLPNDGSRYFGPYASATSVDESMNLVRRLFPFRTCTIDIKEGVRALQRPCLLYHIKRCQGPCIEAIGKEAYRADITQIELFLEGRQETLVKALRSEMTAASEQQAYERAAALRDKVKAIERTMESQKMAGFARTELDVLGLARQDNQAAVQLFTVRAGKLLGRDVFLLDAIARGDRRRGPDELRGAVLRAGELDPARDPRPGGAHRGGAPRGVPRRAACRPGPPPRSPPRREARAPRAGRPERDRDAGPRARPLAGRPGPDAGCARGARRGPRPARAADAHRVLRHQHVPGRPVGRQHGRLRGGPAADRGVPPLPGQDGQGTERLRQPPGGAHPPLPAGPGRRRGQRRGAPLEAARPRHHRRRQGPGRGGQGRARRARAARPAAGRAWPRSARSSSCPAPATRSSCRRRRGALYLVQRLRDEAHRFAITYHRDLRAKASVHSAFDDLPGVGPKRRRALLRVFGSAKRVREAPVEQIAAVPGIGPRLAAHDQGIPRGVTFHLRRRPSARHRPHAGRARGDERWRRTAVLRIRESRASRRAWRRWRRASPS